MGNVVGILAPILIGINGICLIAVEVIDYIKHKDQGPKESEREKEHEEIKKQWDNLL